MASSNLTVAFLAAGLAAGCQLSGVPSAARSFSGTSWRAAVVEGYEAVETGPPTLRFEENGARAAGSTGCNDYFATVSVLGSGIRFEKVGQTQRACPEPLAEQEKRFLDGLKAVTGYRSRSEFLELLDDSGLVRMRLRRAGS